MPISMPVADLAMEFSASLETVWTFLRDGGVFMVCLVALSLLSVAVMLYKAIVLRAENIIPLLAQEALADADQYIASGNSSQLIDVLRKNQSPLSRIGLTAITGGHSDRVEAAAAVEAKAREEVVGLERGIALLEVVITIAPLLGLLGTVSGLVAVFSNLDVGGFVGSRAEVARGIAEALNTTIAGLAIAVPTVVAHSYFTKKLEGMGVRMELLTSGLLSALCKPPDAGGLKPAFSQASLSSPPGAPSTASHTTP
ncbi:MAG: MotA/TolQ/ExbB proton channel family protein [Verrucomicrobiales bacterium]